MSFIARDQAGSQAGGGGDAEHAAVLVAMQLRYVRRLQDDLRAALELLDDLDREWVASWRSLGAALAVGVEEW